MFHRAIYKQHWRNGHDPKDPKSRREREFRKELVFLEPVSEQNGCNFCRLSDSPQEGHAAPLLRGGSLVSVHACAHTHTDTHRENSFPSGYICTTASFTAQRALWKRGHKDGKKSLTGRKSVVKQSLLQKWKRNNGNINGHTDVEGVRFHRVPPLNKEPEKWLLGEGGFAYVGEHRVGGGFNQVILYAFMRLYIYIYNKNSTKIYKC